MTDHPTDAERFFFDNNGYLVLEDFLAPDRVGALYAALERTIERRRDSQFRREHDPAFADRLDAANVRVMHLLAEDPLFLAMLDYEPMMAYVHGLFNEMPHLHSTDAFYEVEPADYHGQGWHIDGIQGWLPQPQAAHPAVAVQGGLLPERHERARPRQSDFSAR